MDIRMIYRILGLLFSLLFFLTILLQFNDVDAWQWVLIYGLGFTASLLFVIKRMRGVWAFVLSCFYVFLSLYVWPEEFEGFAVENGAIDNVERGREAVGLLIAASMMLILGLIAYRKGKGLSKSPDRTPS